MPPIRREFWLSAGLMSIGVAVAAGLHSSGPHWFATISAVAFAMGFFVTWKKTEQQSAPEGQRPRDDAPETPWNPSKQTQRNAFVFQGLLFGGLGLLQASSAYADDWLPTLFAAGSSFLFAAACTADPDLGANGVRRFRMWQAVVFATGFCIQLAIQKAIRG